MRRYYLQYGEFLIDIEERYYKHFNISSGDTFYSNSAKNINGEMLCLRLLGD